MKIADPDDRVVADTEAIKSRGFWAVTTVRFCRSWLYAKVCAEAHRSKLRSDPPL